MKGKKPLLSERAGRFSIATWRRTKTIHSDSGDQLQVSYRTQIQHCRKLSDGSWARQSLWINAKELLRLREVLNKISFEEHPENDFSVRSSKYKK